MTLWDRIVSLFRSAPRVFSPKAWETRHGVQCVKGYCHLRGSSRTFVVRRMSKVTGDSGDIRQKVV